MKVFYMKKKPDFWQLFFEVLIEISLFNLTCLCFVLKYPDYDFLFFVPFFKSSFAQKASVEVLIYIYVRQIWHMSSNKITVGVTEVVPVL